MDGPYHGSIVDLNCAPLARNPFIIGSGLHLPWKPASTSSIYNMSSIDNCLKTSIAGIYAFPTIDHLIVPDLSRDSSFIELLNSCKLPALPNSLYSGLSQFS
ncbi:hypothetical protein E4T56_gene12077 [Termitomyces sp. T112]|nr:hypothetical protein E4T56_gene12077 [Termitomyces sp. T112]